MTEHKSIDLLADLLKKLRRCHAELEQLESEVPRTPEAQREFELQVAALAERCRQLETAMQELNKAGNKEDTGRLLKLNTALQCSLEYLERLTGSDTERSTVKRQQTTVKRET